MNTAIIKAPRHVKAEAVIAAICVALAAIAYLSGFHVGKCESTQKAPSAASPR